MEAINFRSEEAMRRWTLEQDGNCVGLYDNRCYILTGMEVLNGTEKGAIVETDMPDRLRIKIDWSHWPKSIVPFGAGQHVHCWMQGVINNKYRFVICEYKDGSVDTSPMIPFGSPDEYGIEKAIYTVWRHED